MIKIIIIPGLHNSDENHWQTHLENELKDSCVRIHQENWDRPNCDIWVNKIEQALKDEDYSNLILVGHSI